MRAIAGRLKSDYSYANTIVYNNFIWPEPTDEQRHRIEKCAQVVLDARQLYQCPAGVPDNNDITAEPAATLADLYDPDNDFLYPALIRAHQELDTAVEEAYGVSFNDDEPKIVAHLFKPYQQHTTSTK
ncbi:type IIL restriction-modification enzyme MmeI [Corynebacterium poyangense]|uniref:type IIL restriction-modification enzyme MmeI n=1 Tax=Corynebacterium poyangense TaxID=2684405 RepID=UPI0029352F91|nr:type IIL restriction-modification enzyme MmeI [Corynebacterium poyangense]